MANDEAKSLIKPITEIIKPTTLTKALSRPGSCSWLSLLRKRRIFRFMDLPLELRILIYEFTVVSDKSIFPWLYHSKNDTYETCGFRARSVNVSLFTVNRQISREALNVFRRCNEFTICDTHYRSSIDISNKSPWSPSRKVVKRYRYVMNTIYPKMLSSMFRIRIKIDWIPHANQWMCLRVADPCRHQEYEWRVRDGISVEHHLSSLMTNIVPMSRHLFHQQSDRSRTVAFDFQTMYEVQEPEYEDWREMIMGLGVLMYLGRVHQYRTVHIETGVAGLPRDTLSRPFEPLAYRPQDSPLRAWMVDVIEHYSKMGCITGFCLSDASWWLRLSRVPTV